MAPAPANPYALRKHSGTTGMPVKPPTQGIHTDSLDWLFKPFPTWRDSMESGDNGGANAKMQGKKRYGQLRKTCPSKTWQEYTRCRGSCQKPNKDAWFLRNIPPFQDEAFKQPYSTVPPAFKPFETMPEATSMEMYRAI